jgi:hypothetical protein
LLLLLPELPLLQLLLLLLPEPPLMQLLFLLLPDLPLLQLLFLLLPEPPLQLKRRLRMFLQLQLFLQNPQQPMLWFLQHLSSHPQQPMLWFLPHLSSHLLLMTTLLCSLPLLQMCQQLRQ